MKLKIEIDNLTEKQAIAVEQMFNTWEILSRLGSSRYVAFYVDGDGNFHPKILINDKSIKDSEKFSIKDSYNDEKNMYLIDFDNVKKQKYEIKQ